MEQARSTISKIFNGEPRSYTRFNLTQNMEGGDSQVEMKLSADVEEEAGVNGHVHHGRETYARKTPRGPRSFCFLLSGTLLVFIIGYLIGYLVHRKQEKILPDCAGSALVDQGSALEQLQPRSPVPLDWGQIKSLLSNRLSSASIEGSLRDFSSESHQAGSAGDQVLANKVLSRFRDGGLQSWTDEHFLQLQGPPPSGFNQVMFRGEQVGRTKGFLAYSATGTVQGAVVYAFYGRDGDLENLQDMGMSLRGKVLLVRAGRISFAEKVANAERLNASAVLIYPDPADFNIGDQTDLFGHVHLGTGDPYTPGFPSFNHTQFPPVRSSGLPSIVAQTITSSMAAAILRRMGGKDPPRSWTEGELGGVLYKLGDENDVATVSVNNVHIEKKIHNVFGVIKGFSDADRYVVIGAQRDAWGPGFARSTVGTALLVELARSISDLVKKDGFKPRRSLVFASWSAGEYGGAGATEWLEGYLPSLSTKAFCYISLDGVVTGSAALKASASRLLYSLLLSTLKEVRTPGASRSLYEAMTGSNWEKTVMEPITIQDPAYPFMAFSGIPSISFRFTKAGSSEYPYFGTLLDVKDQLPFSVGDVARSAAQVAGHMALRLVHDHLLFLDVEKYSGVIRNHVTQINRRVTALQAAGRLPQSFSTQWLISSLGSFSRGARALVADAQNSDLEDPEQCRVLNDRIMRVERDLLSPYVSPRDTPFRHILLGRGDHTLPALIAHLEILRDEGKGDVDLLRNQFALATWTIQACANSLAGDIWDMDNEV
ncbi:transferrin receptor protein 1-like [Denticeps clupeoides]|uniref:Transferrin receptor protein 1 n=1 Tax=Denticeps clupeoides TaxID=299321 RepID=A0AAY4BB93_9TELE|nr:transferrin receptor protein 1-like [Denticeps clupeoides]